MFSKWKETMVIVTSSIFGFYQCFIVTGHCDVIYYWLLRMFHCDVMTESNRHMLYALSVALYNL